jgi:hypothetical protein
MEGGFSNPPLIADKNVRAPFTTFRIFLRLGRGPKRKNGNSYKPRMRSAFR